MSGQLLGTGNGMAAADSTPDPCAGPGTSLRLRRANFFGGWCSMLTRHDDTTAAHIFAGLVGSGSGAAAGPGSENTWGTAAPPADEGRCVPHRDSTAPGRNVAP